MGNYADSSFSGDSCRDRYRLPDDPSISSSLAGKLCAVSEQDRDTVFDRIYALALAAVNLVVFHAQTAMTNRTHKLGQYLRGKFFADHA
jgi:hypothetical protein